LIGSTCGVLTCSLWDTVRVRPLSRKSMPSVAMSEGTPNLTVMMPLIMPIKAAPARPRRMAKP
jgi:hypothetical protein